MKETYEALKMEVIAFDGEIFTETAYTVDRISNPDGYVPGNNQGPFVIAGN